jgi:hypothetical protein
MNICIKLFKKMGTNIICHGSKVQPHGNITQHKENVLLFLFFQTVLRNSCTNNSLITDQTKRHDSIAAYKDRLSTIMHFLN